MLTSLVLVVAGIAALGGGAEMLQRGGSRLAARLGISSLVIGLTVVSIGTSLPELAIGIQATLAGAGSLAVANIVGTNIVNILLVLGLGALLAPLALESRTLRFGLPALVLAAGALFVMAGDGVLTRVEGGVLVVGAIVYTVLIVRMSKRETEDSRENHGGKDDRPEASAGETTKNVVLLLVGIVVIVLGSDWLVGGAVDLARMIGVSDTFIGLTVVAIGTSLPELATTVVGTIRGDRGIAIGNILGSSVYNIMLMLGVPALLPAEGIGLEPELVRVDIPVMVAVALVCIPVFLSGRWVTRLEGGVFVAAYAVYLAYLLLTRA